LIILRSVLGAPHPTNQARYKNILNKLNRDLHKHNFPKPIEKDLKDNIALSQKYYDSYLNNPTREREEFLSSSFEKIIEEKFGGKFDIRDLVLNRWYESSEDME
jgi:hypothetical protein